MNRSVRSDRRGSLLALGGLGAASMLSLTDQARAQSHSTDWPRHPVRVVVPFAPGGTSEIVARAVAAELSKQLGQSVYVENKPGGAGVSAMTDVAKAAPDGHALVLGHVGTLAVNPWMLKSQPYDVNRDFAPVTLLAKVPNLFVIHPDLPAKNFREFVEHAKRHPGKLNYGSAGNASAGHLAMEYLKLVAGIRLEHIPYRGTGPQLVDLLAGRIDVASAGMPALAQHIRSGKLRAIAVGTLERIPALPDVPTVADMGFAGFETAQWYGLLAPAGTPESIIHRLQQETSRALKAPSVVERFAADNAMAGGGPPSEFAAFIRAEQAIWSDIVRRANIRAD